MCADQREQCGRHQPNVKAEETIDRLRSHSAAALRDVLYERSRNRREAGDVERDLRGEVCVHVPRQQIAGETEHERNEQQEDADDPLQLARRLIGAPDQHLQQVQEDERDHRRRAPVMHRQEEVRVRIQVDGARRFPRRRRRRRVEERQEDARDDLHDHREERGASEDVPITRAARNVLGEEVLRHRDEAGALFDPIQHRDSLYAWYDTTMRFGVFD